MQPRNKKQTNKSTKKRSSKKILDAFQIAERAENGSDESDYGNDDDLEVVDGVLNANRFLKDGSRDTTRIRKDDSNDKFEDEELDSDEALGSDDDYDILNSKFSQTIRDKKKKQKVNERKRRRGEQVSDEDSASDEDDEEGYASIDESQLVSLSEAWDMDDRDLKESQKAAGKDANDGKDVVFDDAWETEESASDSESESESESGSEEEDEEEDDEEDIFKHESGDEYDEDDLDLSNTVSHLKSQLKKPEASKRRLLAETREENEFVLPSGGARLSLNDMIAAVDPSVSKDAFLIDSQDGDKSKALATPLPKRIQDRHDRKVAYEITKEEVSKWEDTVKANRQAEVLKFPMNPTSSHRDTATTFRGGSEPQTDLEKKIHNVLTESALVDDKKEATFEEIAVAKMSLEDMKKRTNELRLMRELMFRDEKRAKRIKKIKSKQFHKIKKKERLRNQEAVEGSDMESDGEDHDLKRARERMTLKHKTQSQWAKSMIKSGLSKDASNRGELEEMLRQGEKLRSKQLGYEDGEQSDDGLSDVENEYAKDNEEADENIKKLGKGVLGMDFMRNAEERSKQANLQELEELRRLENGNDLDAFEDLNSSVNVTKNQGRRVYTPGAASTRADSNSVNQATRDEVEEDESTNLVNKLSKKFDVVDNTAVKQSKSKQTEKETIAAEDVAEEESNPWLSEKSAEPTQKSQKVVIVDKSSSKLAKAAAKIAKSKKRKHGSNNNDDEDSIIDMDGTMKIVDHHQGSDSEVDGDDNTEVKMFRQKDLIKQAFAGDDVVQEFEIEKKRVVRDEDDKEEDMTLPGWGDWAGGNKKSKKRKVVRKIDGVVQKDKRKDKNLKNVIINEKVNKKNLKYQSSAVPFPFESREQYERSLRMPVGQEWTSRETHQRLTMPRIITKQGTVIDPLNAPFKS
ncbi:Utp14 protein-domain-containing protein [Scheffersomyces xylosifermentans]|uniref:Utp14 protein-domain-containing protein n=1 Tax=Scheffersomyces xylosifermentans TaxID=1304137 RepID=UPI00315CF5AE